MGQSGQVYQVCSERFAEADRRVRRLAVFMGLEVCTWCPWEEKNLSSNRLESIPERSVWIVSAENLARMFVGKGRMEESLQVKWRKRADKVLVYGFFESLLLERLLEEWFGVGALEMEVLETRGGDGDCFLVRKTADRVNGAFESLNVPCKAISKEFGFRLKKGGEGSLIEVRGRSVWWRRRHEGVEWYFWGAGEIAPLDRVVSRGDSRLRWFGGLVPGILFFRMACGDHCWNQKEVGACFIIDDPLLHKRYGFLCYEELLKSLNGVPYSISLAFIPWNYRRTDPAVAALFLKHAPKLSLSVHGCDHMEKEFGDRNEGRIRLKVVQAWERMKKHQQTTGVGCDKVMVFPQGVFSLESMKVLKDTQFQAAVNSSPYPAEGETAFHLEELLDLAVTRFSGFPLFLRHYPEDLGEVALDILLNKPVLLVEHHEYFREGYRAMADFFEKVNGLKGNLKWRGLEEVTEGAYWTRLMGDGRWEVKCFSPRLRLSNSSEEERIYCCQGYQRGDGRKMREGEVRLKAGETCLLEWSSGRMAEMDLKEGEGQEVRTREGARYRILVRVRRHLSEFRDNYLSRSAWLLKGARVAKRCLIRF